MPATPPRAVLGAATWTLSGFPARHPGGSSRRSELRHDSKDIESTRHEVENRAASERRRRLRTGQSAWARQRRRVPWAELFMRVLFADALSCVKCSTPMLVLAFISDPPGVAKILRHLTLPDTAPPLAPADPASSGEGQTGGRSLLRLRSRPDTDAILRGD